MNQICSVQYLRGIAALMVVFDHIGIWLRRLGYEGGWPEFLKSGVDIFFVISGFIMWVNYVGDHLQLCDDPPAIHIPALDQDRPPILDSDNFDRVRHVG